MYKKATLLLLLVISFTRVYTQSNEAPLFWSEVSDAQFRSNLYEREIIPEKYITYTFDAKKLTTHLDNALTKTYTERRDQKIDFYLPNPSGEMELYHIWRDDLLPKKLNERYPEISVFAGYAVNDPTKTTRIDITSKGFRAVSYGVDNSTYYIDPIAKGVHNTVISYYKKDYKSQQSFECLVEDAIEVEEDKHTHEHKHGVQRVAGDCQLHTFELALACTGEYATFHGGTKASVMAEYVTSINRINGLYEKEISVNLVFVPNTDDLIFLNAATDPYTNNSGGAMLGENQTTCDNIIGSANYDIGHVYSTGGGGVARLQSPCSNNSKAQGVTGLPSPVGDPFYVDYVAHEMGHQYGATHTYNNSCGGNRTGSTAFEPGSGATIMAYAGICPPNVQFSSDAYFHSASLVQIGNFLNNTSCEVTTDNGSDRPVIGTLSNYNIPVSTPFELVANATTNDGSSLTYCWEQMDNEIANMPPETNATQGPMFRSYTPTVSNSRYFPSLPFLLDNSDNEWEVLPGATRSLNFRVTVRGSRPGQAGCTEESDLVLNVSNSSGPFQVIQPNNNTFWTVGETQSVSWQVANTTAPPVNCDQVRILMSIDGGFTYPIVVLDQTPNDGQVDITVPNVPGTQNRIRVQSVGNVFFDISNENFTIIEPVVPTFTVSASPTTQSACGSNAGVVSYDLEATALSGFDQSVEYTISGLPNGANAAFENNNAVPNATTTLNIDGLENIPTGQYNFLVEANGGGQSDDVQLQLNIIDSNPLATQLMSPANAANNVSTSAPLTWMPVDFADEYIVEISDNPSFANIIYTTSANTTEGIAEGLTTSTIYYWRVRPINICGEGPIESVFRFRTGSEACNTYTSATPTPISTTSGTINSVINVPNGAAIEGVSLSTVILHSWIGDIDCTLIPPQGSPIKVFDRPGIPGSQFGCESDNIRATFDDAATNTADDFENTCGTGLYSIDGDYQSIDAFNTLAGNNSTGDWTLEITDFVDEDGGQLNTWSLEICTNTGSNTPPAQVSNNPLNVVRSNSENISTNELSFMGNGNPDVISYTLITLPNQGTLLKNNILMQVGEQFTQTDINNNMLTYDHSGTPAMTDSFVFDVEETNGGWAPENVFQINIIELNFSGTAQQTTPVTCYNGDDGSISVNPSGGTAPFMYSIDGINFQAENTFNNLPAGEYTITITDADNNTTTTNPVILDNPTQIVLQGTATDNMVSLSASGGSGTLMYSIDNNSFQSSNLFNNLSNGDYTFYVIDANGCTATSEIVSVLANDLSANASLVNTVSCFDASDASISVSISGGTQPFMYSLNSGTPQTSNFFDNLSAGEYMIVVTDANNFMTTTNTIIVNNPVSLELTATANGNQITAMATGGTGAYQYSVDGTNYQNENIFNNLVNGEYTVYIRDENNCINTATATINIATLVANANITREILCNGDLTGSVLASASGGIPPYQFGIGNNFQSNGTFTNLGVGSYIIIVEDAVGAQVNTIVELTQPEAITIQVTTDQSTATINVQGGTPSYSYAIDGGSFQTNSLFENLTNGQHEVVVIDANECLSMTTFNISINMLTASAFEVNPILCAGDSNGSINVNAANGALPYTYSIDGNSFQADPTFDGLSAGTYTVTVIDADDFSTTASVTLSEPTALSLNTVVDLNTISLIASGGTAPYEYSIDGGTYQNESQFNNLAADMYALSVRDNNGCVTTLSETISYEMLAGQLSTSLEIDCSGNSNGVIEAQAIGGVAPYMYSLNGDDFQAASTFTGLSANTYTVTIRDSNGDEATTNSTVLADPNPIIIVLAQDESTLTVNATGGTGDLSYSLDGIDFQSSNIFENLANGDYTVYVADQNACEAEADFTVLVNDLIAILSLSQAITCHDESDGVIVVETSGGTNPKEYTLDGTDFQTSNFFEGLAAGEYTVTVRDANGLTTTTGVVILENPLEISISVEITNNSANIFAIGGTGTLSYSIDGSDYMPGSNFTDLSPGSYTAYVLDANNCPSTEDFEITYTMLEGSVSLSGENLCAGDQLVTATVSASGGTAPYTLSIDGQSFSTSNIFDMLGAGTYTITIQDADGETFTIPSFEITDPSPLNLALQVNDSSVEIVAQGGTAPYQFSINGVDFQDLNIFDNLENGDYTAVVSDANGCQAMQEFSINVLAPLSLETEVTANTVDCTAVNAGTITATGIGGTPPYLYSLNEGPFESTNVFPDLPAGEYRITVQDALMNTVSNLVFLSIPDVLSMDIVITDNNIEVNVSGGTPPYQYSIDNGQTFSNIQIFEGLAVGDYEVVVEDANGCTVTEMISITSVAVSYINESLIFYIQPNPAQGSTQLLLDVQPTETIEISLVDILGRTVRNYNDVTQNSSNSYELNLDGLIPGTYLVRIEMEGQIAAKRLIVQ